MDHISISDLLNVLQSTRYIHQARISVWYTHSFMDHIHITIYVSSYVSHDISFDPFGHQDKLAVMTHILKWLVFSRTTDIDVCDTIVYDSSMEYFSCSLHHLIEIINTTSIHQLWHSIHINSLILSFTNGECSLYAWASFKPVILFSFLLKWTLRISQKT